MSYVIKKVRHGFYLNYVINLELDKIADLEKELKLNEGVLRYELSAYKKTPAVKKATERQEISKAKKENISDDKELKKKVSMEELNQKLDNILENNDNIK